MPAEISTTAPNLIVDWEDRIDEILRADTEAGDKAQKTLELHLKHHYGANRDLWQEKLAEWFAENSQ